MTKVLWDEINKFHGDETCLYAMLLKLMWASKNTKTSKIPKHVRGPMP